MADRPLLVLLLPSRLESFSRRGLAEALLDMPGGVAVEPARVSYEALQRLPDLIGGVLAGMQAKRMRLPGVPRAVVLFAPAQYPLARALLARHADCALWYGPDAAAGGAHHDLAVARSELCFEDSEAGRGQLLAAIERSGLDFSGRGSAAWG